MPDLEFTGERFLPGTPGGIAYEHLHRYAFARRYAAGKRVLDAACGEGYGTALLAAVAASATGVDIDATAVSHARRTYSDRRNASFECASVTQLPLADASVDLVVSFETIEHLPAADQPRMIAEFARVLVPDGVLVLSSPNKRRYSDVRDYRNPFHLHELYRDDLARLLDDGFPHRHWHDQVPLIASAIFAEVEGSEGEAWCGSARGVDPAPVPDALYYVVVAAKTASALPAHGPRLSVLTDAKETELARAEHTAAEVIRLDNMLRERDAHVQHLEGLLANCEQIVQERDGQLDHRTWHVQHLEGLLGKCEHVVQERDAELGACRQAFDAQTRAVEEMRIQLAQAQVAASARDGDLDEARARSRELEAALAAQERIISYRQTLRWWAQLPWVKARSWWQRHAT